MTVIAYKNGMIAGDRMAVSHGIRVSNRMKIGRSVNGVLFGFSGPGHECQILREWAFTTHGCAPVPESVKSAGGILIYPEGRIEMIVLEDGALAREDFDGTDMAATGAGMDIALGAMAAGASALDAALIACRLEIHCGGGVDWIDRHGMGGRVDG